jgi:hypothetical protein
LSWSVSQIRDAIKAYYIDQTRWKYRRGLVDSLAQFVNDVDYFCPALFFSQDLMAPDTRVYNYFVEHSPLHHFSSRIQTDPYVQSEWLGESSDLFLVSSCN